MIKNQMMNHDQVITIEPPPEEGEMFQMFFGTEMSLQINNCHQLRVTIFIAAERKTRGWTLVRKSIPRILDYGREEGILPPLEDVRLTMHFIFTLKDQNGQSSGGVFGLIQAATGGGDEGAESKQKHMSDKVNIPTNDLSTIHEAIPFLPVPVAVFCMLVNFTIPGVGECDVSVRNE